MNIGIKANSLSLFCMDDDDDLCALVMYLPYVHTFLVYIYIDAYYATNEECMCQIFLLEEGDL